MYFFVYKGSGVKRWYSKYEMANCTKIYNKQTIQTALLATDKIHRLRRPGSKPLLRGFGRSYRLVCQRVAVVCVYIFCADCLCIILKPSFDTRSLRKIKGAIRPGGTFCRLKKVFGRQNGTNVLLDAAYNNK